MKTTFEKRILELETELSNANREYSIKTSKLKQVKQEFVSDREGGPPHEIIAG